MSSIRLSRRPWPFGLRCVLAALLALAGLGRGSARAAEPAPVVHTHPIELAAGDFLRAVVVQRADVRVELLDPEGREVVHIDGPNSTEEDEELAAVAGPAGLYQLKVHFCPPAATPADCYTLRLDPPRPATEADRRRAEAVRATQAAVDAMAQGDTEAQLASRKRALALWHSLGERRREAEELYQVGVVQRLRQQMDPAACKLHAAADIYAELGDPAKEARALNEAGIACEEIEPEEAVRDYREALARAREARHPQRQAQILNNLGRLQSQLGQSEEAGALLTEALEIARPLGEEEVLGSILVNLASLQERLYETDRAAELYKQALELAKSLPADRAAALNNLGGLQEDLGNWDEALKLYMQALEVVRQGKDRGRAASTLNNIAIIHMRLGQLDQALAAYREALDEASGSGNLETRIFILSNLGFLYRKMGRPEEALAAWRQVGPLSAGQPDLRHVSLAAGAAIEEEEGRLDAARDVLADAIDWSRERALWQWQADMTIALARVERKRGNLDAALGHIEAAVASIESIRTSTSNPDLRALFLSRRQSYYESWIETLMELQRRRPGSDYATRALQVAERARARSLLDLLGEARADIDKGIDPRLLDKERRLRAAIRELDRESMMLAQRNASPESLATAAERLQKAIGDYEQLETELRASSRSYAALTQPEILEVREIQQRILGDRTLLLELALGEERSYLWAVTRTTSRSFELPGRKQVEEAALAFYGAITARNDLPPGASARAADAQAEAAARTLSGMILRDVEPLLGDNILLVVSDGMLQYVPFAALPRPSVPGERLFQRNQVVSLPSASALAVLRQEIEGRKPAAKTLAVLGDPVFPGDRRLRSLEGIRNARGTQPTQRNADQFRLAPLPFAGEEAKNILALVHDPAQRLAAVGFDASYSLAISGELADYRYVHFATHGLIDSRQPKLSKLALSQFKSDGRPQDEWFLRLPDIYNLDLNADLVVLSACQTALGKEVRGEGLIGLTRGFMYAGAARVLASLWSVEDKATADLMKRFYHHLLVDKRPAADALRRAQLDMTRNPKYHSPYHWAGFSLQGEWK